MDPGWMTAVLQGALAFAAVSGGVALLIKTMGSGYGQLIAALMTQNASQQSAIDGLTKGQKECEERDRETRHKFRNLANTCPITEKLCPLRGIFQ